MLCYPHIQHEVSYGSFKILKYQAVVGQTFLINLSLLADVRMFNESCISNLVTPERCGTLVRSSKIIDK